MNFGMKIGDKSRFNTKKKKEKIKKDSVINSFDLNDVF